MILLTEVEDKNPRDRHGRTPLHYAAKEGKIEICEMILDVVEDKNPKDSNQMTPLHLAAKMGHLEICKNILDEIQNLKCLTDEKKSLRDVANNKIKKEFNKLFNDRVANLQHLARFQNSSKNGNFKVLLYNSLSS